VSPMAAGCPHGALPQGRRRVLWALLLDCATAPEAPEVQALAGVLAAAYEQHGLALLPLTGLGAGATRRLLARWFPGAEALLALDWPALQTAQRLEPRADEIEDLVALLSVQGLEPQEERLWIAHALAQATLGSDHLWQDLHLPSRRELSALMAQWFPALAARNSGDMKWKKFLYKQLCDQAEISLCRSPSCGVCSDRPLCFGPEEAAGPSVRVLLPL
jgi:nitrogen fixation protein NifQ